MVNLQCCCSRRFLLGQNCLEHGFFHVGFEAATGGINEGIQRAGL